MKSNVVPLSRTARRRIEDIKKILTGRGPSAWSGNTIRRINSLSPATLVNALKIGKLLDTGLRRKQIQLNQKSLDAKGVNLPVEQAKIFVSMATHKSSCEKGPRYRDRRQYGTREGEQAVVKRIRQLFAKGKSYREMAETLRLEGHLPRKGAWNPKTVWSIIKNAEQGAQSYKPCTCRMFRDDWERPRSWSVCWYLLRLSDRLFEDLLAAGVIHYDTTINDIRAFQKSRLHPPPAPTPAQIELRRSGIPHLNQVVHGDCLKRIPQWPDGLVSLVVTSPPYGEQRKQYAGKREVDYPEWTVEWMEALRPKLTPNGSVIIIIRSHIRKGVVGRYVIDTITALINAGWFWVGEQIWHKVSGLPHDSNERPRRVWEHVLWFCKTNKPYTNLTACGKPTKRKGGATGNAHGNIHTEGAGFVEGISRVTDMVTAPTSGVDRGTGHPAIFPRDLVRPLILSYAPPGSVVADPFCGSGTTCLVAQSLGYDFLAIDKKRAYVTAANQRLKNELRLAKAAGA